VTPTPDLTPDTLRPQPARGYAALLSGGTQRLRAQHLDALCDALAAGPDAPLVVRLGPYVPGARLAEALPDAMERSLDALRAPGSLYEDRGAEALRSLGSWIFRARTVRRPGLVIVIDDLDRWLDARGRGGDDPAGWFAPIVRAVSERAVSVLGACRAGTAAGTPAVPSSLSALFDRVISLGGPPTVTRDPSSLPATLAGRTFSRPGLVDALHGWLDLPPAAPDTDADDVLVVFSSPLAAPRLSAPDEPLEWARPALVSLPPPRPSPSLAPAPEAPAAQPLSAEALRDAPATLAAQVSLGVALRRLLHLRLDDPDTVRAAFAEDVLPLPRTLDRARRGAAALGAPTPLVLDRARSTLARFELAFAASREAVLAPLPGLAALTARLARTAESSDARGTAVVLLTGWRADLHDHLHDTLRGVGPFRVTASGLAAVDDGLAAQAAAEEDPGVRRVRHGALEAWRVTAYADALRAPGVSLDAGAEAAAGALADALRVVAGGLSGRTAVLLVADAGTSEVIDEAGARGVGDGSAFASVVPWTLCILEG
jgi:hypothetical protein